MPNNPATQQQLLAENEGLRVRLGEAEESLREIRIGELDALMVSGAAGAQLFALNADQSFRLLVEQMGEGALTMTAQGVIVYANRSFAGLLKTSLEKVMGSAVRTWIAPDSQPILQSLLEKGAGGARHEELALAAGDGTRVLVRVSVSHLPIAGMPDVCCLVAIDLTERNRIADIAASERVARELLAAANQSRGELLRVIEEKTRAEKTLRIAEQQQRQLAETLAIERSRLATAQRIAKIGSWETTLATMSVHWSDETHRIHETDPATFQVTHQRFLDYVHPEDRARVNEAFARSLAGGAASAIEHRLLMPDKRTKFVEERWQVLSDSQGVPIRAVGTCQDITERKRIETALRESESRFREMAETIHDVFFLRDAHTNRILYISPAYEKVWGRSCESLYADSESWIESIHPDDRESTRVSYAKGINATSIYEYRIVRPDGSIRWIQSSRFPVHDDAGKIVRTAGVARDITESKKYQEVAEEFFEQPLALHLVCKIDGEIMQANSAWNDILGYEIDKFIGANILDFIHPDDKDKTIAELASLGEGNRTFLFENRYRHQNGSYKDLDWSAAVSLANDGVYAVAIDVTERKKLEQESRELGSMVHNAHDAIFVCDMDQRIRSWNAGAERMYGWSAEEAIGSNVEELLYAGPDAYHGIMALLLESDDWRGKLAQVRNNGRAIAVEAHKTLLRDEHGRPKSILAINTDITERLNLEERIHQSQKLDAIGQLTGGVAHDFNNLLTVIYGNSELLVEQLDSQPRLRDLASMTLTAAQRGADLTHRLLAFARRQPLESAVVDVSRLLANMAALLSRTLSAAIRIEIIHGTDLWPVIVDASQLESAILNLAINARDAMPDGGRLVVESSNATIDADYASRHSGLSPGRYVLLSVADTGTGIRPEDLKRVFEPFFTTKEFGKGTGLGLSTIYGFVMQSHGHVSIYSEPGQGTTVKMYLPTSADTDEVADDAPITEAIVGGAGKILMVEDDEPVRRVGEEQLLKLGYDVVSVANGTDALAILRQTPDIALLFTDMVMPGGMSGTELAKAALAIKPDLCVLYTSGYVQGTADRNAAMSPGSHFLGKPYSRAALALKIRSVLLASGAVLKGKAS